MISGDADLDALVHDAAVAIFKPLRGERGTRMAERFLRRYGGAVAAAGSLPPPDFAQPYFPPEHPVEALRGYRIPTSTQMKRALAQRCAWLDARIGERARLGERIDYSVAELAAIVVLVERLEALEATR